MALINVMCLLVQWGSFQRQQVFSSWIEAMFPNVTHPEPDHELLDTNSVTEIRLRYLTTGRSTQASHYCTKGASCYRTPKPQALSLQFRKHDSVVEASQKHNFATVGIDSPQLIHLLLSTGLTIKRPLV